MDNSKKLGDSLSGISQHAKNSKLEDFGDSVTNASKSLCGLTEAAAQVKITSIISIASTLIWNPNGINYYDRLAVQWLWHFMSNLKDQVPSLGHVPCVILNPLKVVSIDALPGC